MEALFQEALPFSHLTFCREGINIFLAGFVPNQLFSILHNSSQFFSILLNAEGKV
jgi:hypothetical protein